MEAINELLGKHFSGETTPQEEALVANWKKEHGDEYALLEKSWNESIDFEFKSYDDTRAWEKISGKIDLPETKVVGMGRAAKFAIAASFALLIGISLTWYLSAPDFILVANTTDQLKEVKLPDGTTTWLSAGGELQYAADFKTNRDVKLEGTAFFEVAKDAQHPFVIETNMGEVEVLGTGFNVIATDAYTRVSVEHGLVALRNKSGEVKLGEGQTAEATSDAISAIQSNDANVKSWIDGSFIFDHTPLPEVVKQLNTYYTPEIVLETERARNAELTAKFNNQTLQEVIEIIVLTCNLESEFTKTRVVLR